MRLHRRIASSSVLLMGLLALSAWESLLSLEGAAAEVQDALKQFLNQSRQQRLDALVEKAARASSMKSNPVALSAEQMAAILHAAI